MSMAKYWPGDRVKVQSRDYLIKNQSGNPYGINDEMLTLADKVVTIKETGYLGMDDKVVYYSLIEDDAKWTWGNWMFAAMGVEIDEALLADFLESQVY